MERPALRDRLRGIVGAALPAPSPVVASEAALDALGLPPLAGVLSLPVAWQLS